MPVKVSTAQTQTSAGAAPTARLRPRSPGHVAAAFIALWVALLGLTGGSAFAATGVVAVLPATAGNQALAARLRNAVNQTVNAARLGLIGAAELETALQGEAALRDCGTPTCLERLGRLVGATGLLRYSATPQGGGSKATYQLQVDYFNVEVGAQGATLNSTCASCTQSEVEQSLSELTKQALAADAARARGTLAIETTPLSATVFVDGNESGLTPYQRSAFVGSHTVVLHATGYRSQEATVTIADQRTTRLDLRLVAATGGRAGSEGGGTPVYKKWWFWTILGGVAVAAAVTTGVVVSQTSGPAMPMQSINHISF